MSIRGFLALAVVILYVLPLLLLFFDLIHWFFKGERWFDTEWDDMHTSIVVFYVLFGLPVATALVSKILGG